MYPRQPPRRLRKAALVRLGCCETSRAIQGRRGLLTERLNISLGCDPAQVPLKVQISAASQRYRYDFFDSQSRPVGGDAAEWQCATVDRGFSIEILLAGP